MRCIATWFYWAATTSAQTWNPSVNSRQSSVPLNAKYGVFAVQGNYVWFLGPELIHSQLAAQSIEVLVNRGLHVGPRAGQLYLASLDAVLGGITDPIRAFGGYREGNLALALMHEPDFFPMLVGHTPTDVQLSGHSHGGQVRLPALGPVILPHWRHPPNAWNLS
jgi:uncharacterized protein